MIDMRSMLQLLGGVAVAGTIAAGATAFTATGGATNAITGQKSFIGGTVQHTIVGAQLDSLAFTGVDKTDPLGTHVTSFTLTFDANTPTGSVVTLSGLVGTPDSTGQPDNFYCTTVSAGKVSTCTAGLVGGPVGYFTGVGSFNIKVV
jgi:hypothetical protein